MNKICLTGDEVARIDAIVSEVVSQYDSAEDEAFLKDANLIAHELPKRIRRFLNDFKMIEPAEGFCLISNYPIDHEKVGKTPSHWKWRPPRPSTFEEEVILMLFGSLLGDALGWATQQDGRIIHEIFPIQGNEYEQLGTGSEQLLTWHNEDAFHPYRGDYLAMMCLRNPDRVATTLAVVDIKGLNQEKLKLLFEPRFVIRPDESHLEKNRSDTQNESPGANGALASAYQRINYMSSKPEKAPVLFGDPKSPYVRIDPYFMDLHIADEEAQDAIGELIRSLEASLIELILEPGDFVFIDNYKTVHGRKPFRARYDGNDRWLKRINMARDLRKSRTARMSCQSRVLF